MNNKIIDEPEMMQGNWMNEYPVKEKVENKIINHFHKSISSILSFAQLFGVCPVSGLGKDVSDLKFTYHSVLSIYSMLLIFLTSFISVISILHMISTLKSDIFSKTGGIASAASGAVFYMNGLLAYILFYKLAKRWPQLMQKWTHLEDAMWFHNNQIATNLGFKFKIISGIILGLALVEHILSMLINIPSVWMDVDRNETYSNVLEEYNMKSHSFIYTKLQYNSFLGVIVFIVSKLATFTWNFQDLFIVLISFGLSQRLRILNEYLISACELKLIKKHEWKTHRELYAEFSYLVKDVDENISPIVALSFVNNIYFICMQLLNGLRPIISSKVHLVYFYGGFMFLILRAISVTLTAAKINDQSQKSLPLIYMCPSELYTIETNRLQKQLGQDSLYLSGMGFFVITRNFLIAVIGAMATYEIVLLQFDHSAVTQCVVNITDYKQAIEDINNN